MPSKNVWLINYQQLATRPIMKGVNPKKQRKKLKGNFQIMNSSGFIIGKLHIEWNYEDTAFAKSTIENLLKAIIDFLRRVLMRLEKG